MIGAADVNDTSQQPTSRWNRCSEAADNAGIAKNAGQQHSRQRNAFVSALRGLCGCDLR